MPHLPLKQVFSVWQLQVVELVPQAAEEFPPEGASIHAWFGLETDVRCFPQYCYVVKQFLYNHQPAVIQTVYHIVMTCPRPCRAAPTIQGCTSQLN